MRTTSDNILVRFVQIRILIVDLHDMYRTL